jgi:hypothetical protein
VLDKSVAQTQAGVSLTVTDAVADDVSTRISVKIEGIRDLWSSKDVGSQDYSEPTLPQLTYPGGSLSMDHYSQTALHTTSISLLMVFPPLPSNITDPVLTIRWASVFPPSVMPGNWSIPLHFRAGSPNGHIQESAGQVTASDTVNRVTLTLDSVIRMETNDALRIGLTTSLTDMRARYSSCQPLLWTTDQHPIPFVNQRLNDPPYITVMTFPSQRLVPNQTYILRVDCPVILSKTIPAGDPQTTFTVDLGPNPQVGQRWTVDQTITVDGDQIYIRAVRMSFDTNAKNRNDVRLTFEVDPPGNVAGITVEPVPTSKDVTFNQGGSTTFLEDGTERQFPPMLYYHDTPSRKLTFRISAIDYIVQGPWKVTWQMPDLPVQH